MLFDMKNIDTKTYTEELVDFLPDRIIDIHTHVWLGEHRAWKNDARRLATWPDRVAEDSPIEELLNTYELMFPGKQVTPLVFPAVTSPKDDLEGQNAYAQQCSQQHRVPALIWSLPTWSAEELEQKIIAGGFLGLKSYLSHAPAYLPPDEIRIFDTFPHHQLEVLNRNGWIMMLHIPRSGRLKDPVNLAQMVEIDRRYPDIKVIIAHVGRAYCPTDMGNAFEVLADTKHLLFDFSANTCQETFERLIETVGPKRILFGSDLPIARMRMRRICEDGRYVNLVPPGMYGDLSGDANMREIDEDEADTLTFFMYEELKAFRLAAEKTGLKQQDIEDVFRTNACRLFHGLGREDLCR